MSKFIRANALAVTIAGLLVGYAAIGALAAPDVTPWPDPFESPGATAQGGPDQVPAGQPTDLPTDPPTDPPPENTPENNTDVPLDSPACAGDLEDPNPHDTDGDGDGCREVETEDGTKNLPDPAADAHEGHPGDIGDQHQPPHAGTPGPPEGDPPHGNAHGHDDGP